MAIKENISKYKTKIKFSLSTSLFWLALVTVIIGNFSVGFYQDIKENISKYKTKIKFSLSTSLFWLALVSVIIGDFRVGFYQDINNMFIIRDSINIITIILSLIYFLIFIIFIKYIINKLYCLKLIKENSNYTILILIAIVFAIIHFYLRVQANHEIHKITGLPSEYFPISQTLFILFVLLDIMSNIFAFNKISYYVDSCFYFILFIFFLLFFIDIFIKAKNFNKKNKYFISYLLSFILLILSIHSFYNNFSLFYQDTFHRANFITMADMYPNKTCLNFDFIDNRVLVLSDDRVIHSYQDEEFNINRTIWNDKNERIFCENKRKVVFEERKCKRSGRYERTGFKDKNVETIYEYNFSAKNTNNKDMEVICDLNLKPINEISFIVNEELKNNVNLINDPFGPSRVVLGEKEDGTLIWNDDILELSLSLGFDADKKHGVRNILEKYSLLNKKGKGGYQIFIWTDYSENENSFILKFNIVLGKPPLDGSKNKYDKKITIEINKSEYSSLYDGKAIISEKLEKEFIDYIHNTLVDISET